jgi:hypothetical protein
MNSIHYYKTNYINNTEIKRTKVYGHLNDKVEMIVRIKPPDHIWQNVYDVLFAFIKNYSQIRRWAF